MPEVDDRPGGPTSEPEGAVDALRERAEGGGLRGARLVGADLQGANLSGVDLTGANLQGADLRGATLVGATLTEAILDRARLDGAELLGAVLRGADLSDVEARRVGFGGADLRGADFFNADLEGATFTKAKLEGADLRAAKMVGCRLRDADLRDANLDRADLREADLQASRIDRANFAGARLAAARLRGVSGYDTAYWIGAEIATTDFTGAYRVRRTIMDENFLHEFRTSTRLNGVLYRLWWLTSDCGRSLKRWALATALITAAFGAAYSHVALDLGDHPTSLSPFYFSVVTLTTLGYGDVTPMSVPAQLVAMLEVVVGYVMLGGLISILSAKMARRAE